MGTVLSCDPVTSVDEAVAQMTEIARALPPTDGVAEFNRMYLSVTTAVGDAIKRGFFTNSEFLNRLDVVFANHYFAALKRAQTDGRVPHCWDVLWKRRDKAGVAPMQFAFAGMNAHINHDLVLALVETMDELNLDPDSAAVHDDFDRVNKLLAELDGPIRRSFEDGLLLRLEQHWSGIEDRVDGWSIAAARSAAWHDASILWRVRHHPRLRQHYEQLLDEAVAVVGRCLLEPVDPDAQRPAHVPFLTGVAAAGAEA